MCTFQKIVLKVDIHDDKQKRRAMKAISGIEGIESIAGDLKDGTLTVTGDVDPVRVCRTSKRTPIRRQMENLSEKNISSFLLGWGYTGFQGWFSDAVLFCIMVFNLYLCGEAAIKGFKPKLKLNEDNSSSLTSLKTTISIGILASRSASIHHHIKQTSDDHGVVHGVYVVVEGGGQREVVGGAPLVVVEGGEPRGLQVVEGGGGRLVVGGEDGGGEVVILASC
ncbi:heavy metal-associated isoprenylated plant protein 39 [Tanacetum coccineum]